MVSTGHLPSQGLFLWLSSTLKVQKKVLLSSLRAIKLMQNTAPGTADPVAALRKIMAQPDKAVQAYIVPSEDPHMVSLNNGCTTKFITAMPQLEPKSGCLKYIPLDWHAL